MPESTSGSTHLLMTSRSDQILVGNDAIDSDHQHLFDLANQFHAARDNVDSSIVRTVLDKLMTFAQEHFAREEALMTEIGYSELAAHVVEHRLLAYHLRNLHLRSQSGDKGLEDELEIFMDRLFSRHIMAADLRLAEKIRETRQCSSSSAM